LVVDVGLGVDGGGGFSRCSLIWALGSRNDSSVDSLVVEMFVVQCGWLHWVCCSDTALLAFV